MPHLDFDQAEVAEEDGLDRFAEHDGLKDSLIPQDLCVYGYRRRSVVRGCRGVHVVTAREKGRAMVQALLFAR